MWAILYAVSGMRLHAAGLRPVCVVLSFEDGLSSLEVWYSSIYNFWGVSIIRGSTVYTICNNYSES